ncbi:16S rRNA (uracil(1498)-N(3))-methyltransferase [Clostridium tyrobutyricum]|jgi:16S rRNA (uracil1498-N3)-methyltransferase|uniref:Ribosomal RNA small subunit methyltransferase E n=3 Tax=Clostridium tyrobutyricum TaxID=1519 RepID=W6N868_CLOTY|nr:16S rRNA (uracil(1498)-N(3))-methyltransferase [Clostridium tyrobutyricum]AND85668.1 ribosomal RNA small subunit methyltransferase E [Clostridium tyrobutyricum]ANP70190.1 16S rRNA methyltransferase [Clostridium tyrobutyricum]MBV4415041.1 16S rRNA (uracil(1498)-N(3))-methyltransferase [Clostridium tyrobutyricum]MBV4421133.1 16S rRNA (uracil(1498)-N(3))-methyltransferase [Clostridium tyrobutyricum]MBV4424397.1 16S rRNA (uracil(1498)-N(3))-methyltransferase [Clostridium tyrobutyricum]
MHKFFVSKENIMENTAYILGEDVRHIYKVLRLKPGDKVSINDCCGEEFLGSIKTIDREQVQVEILEKLNLDNESNIDVYLFQGFPKSSKMDLIVQKATELGVKGITPIFTDRVVVKNKQGELKKVDRWNRIVKESCKQCKRSIIPKVNNPMEFKNIQQLLKNIDLIIVPYENEQNTGIKNLAQNIDKNKIESIGIIVGPEGGFAEEEINTLKDIGANIVTLGPRILRTETAGFVCTSLLMYEFGDLGGSN